MTIYVFLYCGMILLPNSFSDEVNLSIRSTKQNPMSLAIFLSLSLSPPSLANYLTKVLFSEM